MIADLGCDLADDARLVFVLHGNNDRSQCKVCLVAEEAYEHFCIFAYDRTGNGELTAFLGDEVDNDHAAVTLALCALALDNFDAVGLDALTNINEAYASVGVGRKETLQRRQCQDACLLLGQRASEPDFDLLYRNSLCLVVDAAELLSEIRIRTDSRHIAAERRHVDGRNQFTAQCFCHQRSNGRTNVVVRFLSRRTQVRCHDAVRKRQKRVLIVLLARCLIVRRLLVEYVDGCGGNLTGLQCLVESRLIYETATGGVYDADALLALGQFICAHHADSFLVLRSVECDEIGNRKKILELGAALHADLVKLLLRDVRVVSYDCHADTLELSGYDGTDTAETDDTGGLALELVTDHLGTAEIVVMCCLVGMAEISEDGECMGHSELTCRHDVGFRSVDCDDALLGAGSHVDVVDTVTGTADDLEVLGIGQKILIDLCYGTDDQRIVITDETLDLVLGAAQTLVYFKTFVLQILDGICCNLLGN